MSEVEKELLLGVIRDLLYTGFLERMACEVLDTYTPHPLAIAARNIAREVLDKHGYDLASKPFWRQKEFSTGSRNRADDGLDDAVVGGSPY